MWIRRDWKPSFGFGRRSNLYRRDPIIVVSIERRQSAMTYCVGVMLDTGLIFASDSRTHAEVDNFAKFCKMTVFERAGDRVIVLLSSGNLAGTQAVISVLKQRGDVPDGPPNLWTARTMF